MIEAAWIHPRLTSLKDHSSFSDGEPHSLTSLKLCNHIKSDESTHLPSLILQARIADLEARLISLTSPTSPTPQHPKETREGRELSAGRVAGVWTTPSTRTRSEEREREDGAMSKVGRIMAFEVARKGNNSSKARNNASSNGHPSTNSNASITSSRQAFRDDKYISDGYLSDDSFNTRSGGWCPLLRGFASLIGWSSRARGARESAPISTFASREGERVLDIIGGVGGF
eukprot:GHVN01012169.1.p1 GENE.GHVN01012169.1~~GHVN01012169.1.p1  ORF type:complete len:229 (-),score=56.04 GHVN01012169.1:69-755(-)